jgi:hypothetical protein
MRQRTISAAAGLSASLAVFCLGTGLTSGQLGPFCGFVAGAVAAAAALRARLRRIQEPGPLRLCPHGGVLAGRDADGDGEAVFWPIGVTGSLICLARTGRSAERRSIWRDGVAPDGFRRIAALGLWRRDTVSNWTDHSELIARIAVTEQRTAARTEWPRAE